MTPEEAIKTFKTVVVYAPEKYEKKYYKAIMLAIGSLEKQIPKKPSNYDGKIKSGFCPGCEAVVTSDFCDNCGQALDWSDEE